MRHVFISYRHDDSKPTAARVADALRRALGPKRVFFDERSIEESTDWESVLTDRLAVTTLFVAVIGSRWFDDERRRRLASPVDVVRREIAAALRAQTPVLPVLVDGARMPEAKDLPEDIRALAGCQALLLPEPYFDDGVRRIINRVLRPTREERLRAGVGGLVVGSLICLVLIKWGDLSAYTNAAWCLAPGAATALAAATIGLRPRMLAVALLGAAIGIFAGVLSKDRAFAAIVGSTAGVLTGAAVGRLLWRWVWWLD